MKIKSGLNGSNEPVHIPLTRRLQSKDGSVKNFQIQSIYSYGSNEEKLEQKLQ
jgi:hypothetical protein